jgi:hypothetical protein
MKEREMIETEHNNEVTRLTRRIEQLVDEINEAFGVSETNRMTFGYIGIEADGYDARRWYVFLPHPGRTGTEEDRLGGGFRTGDVVGMRVMTAQLAAVLKTARWATRN